MISLILLMCLGELDANAQSREFAPVVEATDLRQAARASGMDPGSPEARLDLARALVATPGYEEEAHEVLMPLLDDPVHGGLAGDILADLCASTEVRPGWAPTYRRLLQADWSDPKDARRDRLRLRSAELDLRVPSRRAQAIRTLESLAETWPADPVPRVTLAHGLMLNGEPDRALEVLQPALPSAETWRLKALAALAGPGAGTLPEALRSGGAVEGPDAWASRSLRMALLEPSSARAAVALDEAGYGDLAIARVKGAGGGLPEDPDALAVLGQLAFERNQVGLAEQAFARAQELEPGHGASQVGQARIAWQRGQTSAALAKLDGVDADVAEAIYAESLISSARLTSSTEDDDPALVRAFELAPENPKVSRAYARTLFERKDYAGVVAPIEAALAVDPGDREMLGYLVHASAQTGAATQALEPVREGCRQAKDVKERAALIDQLASVYVLVGEQYKREDQRDEAVAAYSLAAALRPSDPDVLMGLGGLWWGGGELDAAYASYLQAHKVSPRRTEPIATLAELESARGNQEAALSWLAKAKGGGDKELRARLQREQAVVSARAKAQGGDVDAAVKSFQELARLHSDDPAVQQGLGDALSRAKRPDEALAAYQKASRLDPEAPWPLIGSANALLSMGEVEKAEAILNKVPRGLDVELDRQAQLTTARLHRVRGGQYANQGMTQLAFSEYSRALELEPETWALTSLGWLYFEQRQFATAIAFFDEAAAMDSNNSVARRGRALALSELGSVEVALAEAEALLEEQPSDDHAELVSELKMHAGLQAVENMRATGDFAGAEIRLASLMVDFPKDPNVGGTLASVLLEQERYEQAYEQAARVLVQSPGDPRAVAVLIAVAEPLNAHTRVRSQLQQAAKSEDAEAARRGLELLDTQEKLAKARELKAARRSVEARRQLEEASRYALEDPDQWSLIGGGWLDLGDPTQALASYDKALGLNEDHVPAILGRAGALTALGRPNEATEMLDGAWRRIGDPELGLALARLQAKRGDQRAAEATVESLLNELERPDRRTTSVAATPPGEPLPILALPSGRSTDPFSPSVDPASAEPINPETVAFRDEAEELLVELRTPALPAFVGGVGALSRPGFEGRQYLTAYFVPLALQEFKLGPVRLSAEVIPIWLSDGKSEETGASFALGADGPVGRNLDLGARVGMSPAGFTGGSDLTWYARAAARGAKLHAELETGRTPVTDSLTSWAGGFDPVTNVAIGRVSRTWLGGTAAYRTENFDDLGAAVRLGYIEGLGMESNSYTELAVWGLKNVQAGDPPLLLGAEGTLSRYDRQVDGFTEGEGGTFSPPLYAAGYLRLRGEVDPGMGRSWACWSVGTGPQHLQGEDSIYFSAGTHMGMDAQVAFNSLVRDGLQVTASGRAEVTVGEWYQLTAMVTLASWKDLMWTKPGRVGSFSPIHGNALSNAQGCRPR